jgi:hypothetical protein
MKKLIISLPFIALLIAGFTNKAVNIDPKEKDAILYMREEEKLARDVYDSLYVKWDVNPFGNIRLSEQVHMDKMKTLITNNNLKDPVEKTNDVHGVFINTTMQKYYDELVVLGSRSLTDALKAGAKIEELDIADLDARIKQAKAKDVITAFEFLRMGSENHLRAFVRRLKMQGITYEPVILDKKTFDVIIASENKRGGCGNGCK